MERLWEKEGFKARVENAMGITCQWVSVRKLLCAKFLFGRRLDSVPGRGCTPKQLSCLGVDVLTWHVNWSKVRLIIPESPIFRDTRLNGGPAILLLALGKCPHTHGCFYFVWTGSCSTQTEFSKNIEQSSRIFAALFISLCEHNIYNVWSLSENKAIPQQLFAPLNLKGSLTKSSYR